jgi:PilZ domain
LLLHRAHKGALLLPSDIERRRFQRLLVTLPVEFTACHPESGELHQGHGVLKDFSLSGVFFHSLDPVPFQPGHTLTLTISTPLAPLSQHDVSCIRVQAEVVRLEEPSPESAYHGVAVSFLEFPCFLNLTNQVNNHC